jgi:hypothetical protein
MLHIWNGYTHILQVYVTNVSADCLIWTYVARIDLVLHMLQWAGWGATRLGADLEGGAAVQGCKEGSAA